MKMTALLNREKFLQRIADRHEPLDIAIVGGGATGVSIAVRPRGDHKSSLLFLDPRPALAQAPQVARELRRHKAWLQSQLKDFAKTADHFIPPAS